MCSRSVSRTLRSYCKMRYLMSLLRKHHHLARHRYSQLSHFATISRRDIFKNLNQNDKWVSCFLQLRDFSQGRMHLQTVRFYSSSNRDVFKPQPPIGIVEESQRGFDWKSLGGHFGQSFIQLSTHINHYFKKKDNEPVVEKAHLDLPPERPVTHGRNRRRVSVKNTSEDKVTAQVHTHEVQQETTDESQSNPEKPGLQLFHISSFANRFGESYTYVANHINAVFSKSLAFPGSVSSIKGTHRGRKRKTISNSCNVSSEDDKKSQVKSVNTEQAAVESKDLNPGSWEETYQHFARHINKYFGAMATDETHEKTGQLPVEKDYTSKSPTQPTSQTTGATSHMKQQDSASQEKGGLFHSSHTTDFAENYLQMASHINQYFKGQSALDGDTDAVHPTSERLKPVSVMDCLRNPTSAIPDWLGYYINPLTKISKPQDAVASPGAKVNKKLFPSGRAAEETRRRLIDSLCLASSPGALLASVEALNEHLICYPSCKALMWQEKTAGTLVKMRRTYRDDQLLQSALRETLALIGYVDPVKGRGIRVLSIDGGGTRGIVPLQVLKLLEIETGKKIHQLFDYICGVSTGAILAFMLGLAHFSLEECGDMYRRFGSEVFRQNPLVGTVQMGWSHSYYKTETWETILQEKLGNRVLIKTARDQFSPKVSAVSAVVNWGTSPKAFVFRNYNHKPGSLSRYAGSSGFQMWQAVRASSAAPGYFQEFPLQSDIHQDGGILLNNPCALAVHESRLLWPNQPFQCVLSLGTGRYDNAKKGPATSTSLRAKISNLICSATDTEGVHTLLDDLLPPDVYFRLNPMLSTLVSLDESRPGALEQLLKDTQTYLERNHPKLSRLCLVLGAERSAVNRSRDWMSERVWEMKQRWV